MRHPIRWSRKRMTRIKSTCKIVLLTVAFMFPPRNDESCQQSCVETSYIELRKYYVSMRNCKCIRSFFLDVSYINIAPRHVLGTSQNDFAFFPVHYSSAGNTEFLCSLWRKQKEFQEIASQKSAKARKKGTFLHRIFLRLVSNLLSMFLISLIFIVLTFSPSICLKAFQFRAPCKINIGLEQ